jgi:hypothetical protein
MAMLKFTNDFAVQSLDHPLILPYLVASQEYFFNGSDLSLSFSSFEIHTHL